MELKNYEKYIDVSLTEKLNEEVKYLKEYPFIGKDYTNPISERILILGKSIYNWQKDEEAREKVEKVYQSKMGHIYGVLFRGFRLDYWDNFRKNDNKVQFNREIEKTFFRTENIYSLDFEEKRAKFWKSIAHYQLIQKLMENSNHEESDNDRDMATKGLLEVTEILLPDHIVMFSNDYNYQNSLIDILNLRVKKDEIIYGAGSNFGSDIRSVKLKYKGKDFWFTSLVHPSARGKAKPNFQFQNDLLKKVMPDYLNYLNTKE